MSNPSQAILARARAHSSSELQSTVRRAAWGWLSERITRFVRMLAAELSARRATWDLEVKDDHELRDLGILRSDIARVVRQTGSHRAPPRLFDDAPRWQWPPR